jgi:hypothetical protein
MSIGFVVAIIVIVVGVVIVGFVTSRRRSEDDAVAASPLEPAPWPIDDGSEAVLVPRDPDITWPSRLGSAAGRMDDGARLRLIKDLGLIRAAWVVPILIQASKEERGLSHQDAVQQALAACDQTGRRDALEPAGQPSDV